MTPAAFLSAFAEALADDGGLVFVLLVIVFTGIRRVWVFSRELDRIEKQLTEQQLAHIEEVRELKTERDRWRSAALWTLSHPTFQGKHPPGMPPLPEGD